MVLPSLQPSLPLPHFENSCINSFPIASSLFSKNNSINKIREEELKTKVPPFYYYYDQLNQDLAARSSRKFLNEEKKLQNFFIPNRSIHSTLSYTKYSASDGISMQPFKEEFHKKSYNDSFIDMTPPASEYLARGQLIRAQNSSRDYAVSLAQFQLSPLLVRRKQSSSFRMENLLQSSYFDTSQVASTESCRQKEHKLFSTLHNANFIQDFASYKASSCLKTPTLTHDKYGRFPEIRNAYEKSRRLTFLQQKNCNSNLEQNLEQLATIKFSLNSNKDNCASSECNDRDVDGTKHNSLCVVNDHGINMRLGHHLFEQNTIRKNLEVQCSKIDSNHTSDEIKYGVEGLLGLTMVSNERLNHVLTKEKKRAKNNNCLHLWQFLQRMLNEEENNANRSIEWTNRDIGEFRLIKTAVIADLWGQSKNRNCMTYEKMARAMRYYYKMKILEKVPHKRLHFRFGENMLPKVSSINSKISVESLKMMDSKKSCYTQMVYKEILENKPLNANIHFDEIKLKLQSKENLMRKAVVCPINNSENLSDISRIYKQLDKSPITFQNANFSNTFKKKYENTQLQSKNTRISREKNQPALREFIINEEVTDEHIDVENSDEEASEAFSDN